MSANLNKVFLIGRLTKDPELKYTQKGTAVVDIRVATNRTFTTEGGEKKDEPCFVDVTLWARQAEVCAEYLAKGAPLFVEGRLEHSAWETEKGEKRSKIRIICEHFQFLDGPAGNGRKRKEASAGASAGACCGSRMLVTKR